MVSQLIKKFPIFYGMWSFIIMITGVLLVTSLILINPALAPALQSCVLKVHLNIILVFVPRSPKWKNCHSVVYLKFLFMSFYLWNDSDKNRVHPEIQGLN
jgi:hypothetical protein